jgi:hypothetical protein
MRLVHLVVSIAVLALFGMRWCFSQLPVDWAVPACTLFALGLVLLQYGVSDALYGVGDRRPVQ